MRRVRGALKNKKKPQHQNQNRKKKKTKPLGEGNSPDFFDGWRCFIRVGIGFFERKGAKNEKKK